MAILTITSTDPKNPRGYIDGQVYGVRYLPQAIQEALQNNTPGAFVNPSDLVSLLVWNAYEIAEHPMWYEDMQPIFTQYANLYPIMDTLIDLSDYESIAKNTGILSLVFSLPVGDPNSMPVTRDLSPGKRTAILRWLNEPGKDGKPLLGTPPVAAAAMEIMVEEAPVPTTPMNRMMAIKSGRVIEGEE